MFIYHIWAHVAQQKPMDSEEQFTNLQLVAEQQNPNGKNNSIVAGSGVADAAPVDEQRSDVTRLHMCPECLLEQPTPYRARLHYHRVHKRGKRPLLDNKHGLNVCNICEQVIDAKSMSPHIAGHHLPDGSNQLALPYWCRFSTGTKCQFRTSNRGALLQHFCTKHVGTRVVLCPFCLQSFSVPPADKRGALVRMRNFVQHMAQHDAEKSRYCGLCVTRIPVSQRQQVKTHQEQHGKHNDDQKWLQWQMQRLDLNTVLPDNSRALVSSDVNIAQCVECGQMVHNLSKHFDKERRWCTFCAFATRCAHAMERHHLLAQCNAANKARTPFAGWTSSVRVAPLKSDASASSPSSVSLVQFACTFCTTFRSVSVQVMADHLAKVHKTPSCSGARVRLLRHSNKDNNGGTNKSGKEMAKPIGGEEGQLQLNVVAQLKQYTMEVVKEELHEAELFGLRRMGDTPLEEQLQQQQEEETNDNGHQTSPMCGTTIANATTNSERVEAMRDWLLTFMPLFHANRLIQCVAVRLEQARLLSAMMAQDDGAVGSGDNAQLWTTEQRAKMIEEELKEERIKMSLMFDY